MEIAIEKLDNLGRGICFVNNKITFIKAALPGEIVKIKIIKETKKYNEGIVVDYIKKSEKRLKPICPYYGLCGGCQLLSMSYEDTLAFKKEKLQSILYKYANYEVKDLTIIPSITNLNYRNKMTLKIKNGNYGYYEENTHQHIPIKSCFLVSKAHNKVLPYLKYLNINNGEVILRTNHNDEILINVKTKEEIKPNLEKLKENIKLVGLILNDDLIYGENHLIYNINNLYFKCSYDSFFQVNNEICSKLFYILKENINSNDTILDLYCGVGTLGINVSASTTKVYGIEIVKNAILNAITNAKINHKDNIKYLLGDVSKCLPKIKDQINTIIIDPPRKGLDNNTIETIIKFKPTKIIYISCNPMTLARDLKILLEFYDIKSIKGLDMFPYTYHVECMCVLNRL